MSTFNEFLSQLLRLLPPPHEDLILPEDDRYEAARRVWNDAIDRYPCMIIQARGATDVVAVLRCCTEHNVAVTIRGGGHSVAGTCVRDGAVLLDLSAHMRNVLVDPQTQLVHVGGGATWRDVDRETAPYSLSVPAGLISHTGVGGLTLGGGLGWLSRQGGLSCDALESVLLITATGQPLRLSRESTGKEAELWWALRGGGQGLGVVIEFVFRAVKTTEAHIMRLEFPLGSSESKPVSILKAFHEVARVLPREVSLFCFVVRGGLVLEATATIPFADWEKHMAPLMLEDPGRTLRRTTTIANQNAAYDSANSSGRCFRWSRSTFLPPDVNLEKLWLSAISPTLRQAIDVENITVEFMHLGGKIAEVERDASAFLHRQCLLEVHAIVTWKFLSDKEAGEIATRCAAKFSKLVAPFGIGSYANTDGTDAEDRATSVYGSHLPRLRAAKALVDPNNLLPCSYAIGRSMAQVPMEAKKREKADAGALAVYLLDEAAKNKSKTKQKKRP